MCVIYNHRCLCLKPSLIVNTALKDALCTTHTPRTAPPSLLLHIRLELQQGFLYKHLAPDWSEWDSKANLLLWDTDLYAASSLSVVLATWGTGGRVAGTLEELPWRRSEHVWCLMMKHWKSGILLNNTLWINFCLVVWLQGKLYFSAMVCHYNALWKKHILFHSSSPFRDLQ